MSREQQGLKLCLRASFGVTVRGVLTSPFIAGRITMAVAFLKAG